MTRVRQSIVTSDPSRDVYEVMAEAVVEVKKLFVDDIEITLLVRPKGNKKLAYLVSSDYDFDTVIKHIKKASLRKPNEEFSVDKIAPERIPSKKEIKRLLDESVKEGFVEARVNPDGKVQYRLTAKGEIANLRPLE